jgi:hypothetical protein
MEVNENAENKGLNEEQQEMIKQYVVNALKGIVEPTTTQDRSAGHAEAGVIVKPIDPNVLRNRQVNEILKNTGYSIPEDLIL